MQTPSLQAWNRLRSLIKECLTFAQLKDTAASAGLEMDRLAHLQQKSLPERGASKSELLDEIGRLFSARAESDRIEILEVFARECLRKFPDRESDLSNKLRPSGIILTNAKRLYVFAPHEYEPTLNPGAVKPTLAPLSPAPATRPIVFVSYSHTDVAFKDQLAKHLKALTFEGTLTFWSDDQISPSAAWFDEINRAIKSADVAVLLVTSDFLASDFIRQHEMNPILARYRSGDLKLVWIPVRACNWEETPLREIQSPISPNKPIAEMKAERDRAWVTVCRAVRQATGVSKAK